MHPLVCTEGDPSTSHVSTCGGSRTHTGFRPLRSKRSVYTVSPHRHVNADSGSRTHTSDKGHRALDPARLPIPSYPRNAAGRTRTYNVRDGWVTATWTANCPTTAQILHRKTLFPRARPSAKSQHPPTPTAEVCRYTQRCYVGLLMKKSWFCFRFDTLICAGVSGQFDNLITLISICQVALLGFEPKTIGLEDRRSVH